MSWFDLPKTNEEIEQERQDELQQYHNDGQEADEYKEPHGFVDVLLNPSDTSKEDNEAYEKGWDNAHK